MKKVGENVKVWLKMRKVGKKFNSLDKNEKSVENVKVWIISFV